MNELIAARVFICTTFLYFCFFIFKRENAQTILALSTNMNIARLITFLVSIFPAQNYQKSKSSPSQLSFPISFTSKLPILPKLQPFELLVISYILSIVPNVLSHNFIKNQKSKVKQHTIMGRQRVVHRDRQRKKRKLKRERQHQQKPNRTQDDDNDDGYEYEYDEYVTIINHTSQEQVPPTTPSSTTTTTVTQCRRTLLLCDTKDGGEGTKQEMKQEMNQCTSNSTRTTATGTDLPDTTTAVRTIPSSPPKDGVVSTNNDDNGSRKESVSNDTDTDRIERMRAKKRQRKEARRMKQQRGATTQGN